MTGAFSRGARIGWQVLLTRNVVLWTPPVLAWFLSDNDCSAVDLSLPVLVAPLTADLRL